MPLFDSQDFNAKDAKDAKMMSPRSTKENIRIIRSFVPFVLSLNQAAGIIERILRSCMPVQSRKQEFWSGVRDEAPILLGVIPFGLLFGALTISAQLSSLAAQAMSAIIFAGSAQLIAAQLVATGSSGLVILMVVFVVNLRHALYSASVAPHLKSLNTTWKLLLAYLLTDEAYAVTITHYNREGDSETRHWYFLGAGLTLWCSWQISTAIGIFIGAQIPPSWPLGFILPLTFIALVVPALKDRAGVAAALAAGAVGLLAFGLPYKIGLLMAALIGILSGLLVEGKRK
jgi:4-azaleucine resistance transporter AzlC